MNSGPLPFRCDDLPELTLHFLVRQRLYGPYMEMLY